MSGYLKTRSTHLRRQTKIEERRSAPRTDRGGVRRLAEQVRDRFPFLHGTSWKRLAPALGKFDRAGWVLRDFEIGIRDLLAVRGHRIPAHVKYPAPYLAALLRDLDPADRPSVLEDAYEAARRAQAAAERAARRAHVLALAGKCPHGVPAQGAGQPSRGVLACLECRRTS